MLFCSIGKLRHNAHVHLEKVFLELEQSEAQKKELKKNLEQSEMQLKIWVLTILSDRWSQLLKFK